MIGCAGHIDHDLGGDDNRHQYQPDRSSLKAWPARTYHPYHERAAQETAEHPDKRQLVDYITVRTHRQYRRRGRCLATSSAVVPELVGVTSTFASRLCDISQAAALIASVTDFPERM